MATKEMREWIGRVDPLKLKTIVDFGGSMGIARFKDAGFLSKALPGSPELPAHEEEVPGNCVVCGMEICIGPKVAAAAERMKTSVACPLCGMMIAHMTKTDIKLAEEVGVADQN